MVALDQDLAVGVDLGLGVGQRLAYGAHLDVAGVIDGGEATRLGLPVGLVQRQPQLLQEFADLLKKQNSHTGELIKAKTVQSP